MNRGMTVLSTWRLLLGDKTPTDEEYYCATVLAWCVEFVRELIINYKGIKSSGVNIRYFYHFSCKHFSLLLMT